MLSKEPQPKDDKLKNEESFNYYLIFLIVGLIIILGIIGGVTALAYMNTPTNIVFNTTNNTTEDNTTTALQNITNTTTTPNASANNTSTISSSQAADIALNSAKKSFPTAEWSVGSVDFVPAANYENTPNYMVELSNSAPDALNTTGNQMDIRVNAQTGAIIP